MVRGKQAGQMHVAREDLHLDHLYVVHPGVHRFALDDAITAIPLPALIDELLAPKSAPPAASRP